jgi:predicted amidohydrolase YtcJ
MSKDEIVERVEAYVKAQGGRENLEGRWVEGMGWDQNRWSVKEFPTAVSRRLPSRRYQLTTQADLDASPILRDLPIALARIDVHALWVSRAILDAMGELPLEVDGGHIVRDEQGKPTGIFGSHKAITPESTRLTCRLTMRWTW